MAAVFQLEFLKIKNRKRLIGFKGQVCVTVTNFVAIGQTVAEI